MGPTAVKIVAGIIDWIEKPPIGGRGRTPAPAETVLETLRFFLREGPQWRELRATAGAGLGIDPAPPLDGLEQYGPAAARSCRVDPNGALGSRGRRRSLEYRRGHCSVRAKHGGELTGPNPTDRGKPGTKYHLVVSTDGLPLGVLPSSANVHDSMMFPDLLRLAMAVCATIGHLYADAEYDSIDNRGLCLRQGIQPHIRKIGSPHGSGLGAIRCVVEHVNAWLLANKRLDRRSDRLGKIVDALLNAACILMIANRLADL